MLLEYLTRTAQQSDLVLPTTSFFEEEDLHVSFWHHWLSLNQKILPTFFEAKSDLQIACELTEKLNSLHPGFSNFSADKGPMEWIEEEISPQIKELYVLDSAFDLSMGPHKRRKETPSPTWKYSFSPLQPEISPQVESSSDFPYQLLTPQSLLKFQILAIIIKIVNG
ncbi:molybdopterin-dependent oxidoreductase [Desulfitobacterium sp.]|uniref:molybdopterin-dependent oxidoreductase n=1 Tax=Desulfitobacterium sp. TaxID=49981 RepID=UPI002BF2D44D|nr:molybdopterin-dependent oxidoreductase [Desulfitobacterium sp.]HVJ50019.1 molybdopterin-dependent oxidoreductase [Desulfitobacterium sp.]